MLPEASRTLEVIKVSECKCVRMCVQVTGGLRWVEDFRLDFVCLCVWVMGDEGGWGMVQGVGTVYGKGWME